MTISFRKVRYKNITNWSVSHLLANQFDYNQEFKLERIGNFLIRNKTQITVEDRTEYKRVTIRLYNKGIKLRDIELGKKIGTKKQYLVKKGQFLMSKIDARNGAFGIATAEVDGAIITADFFAYDIDETKIIPQFLVLLTTTKQFQRFAQSASSGTTGRQRMDEKKFLDVKIPLPPVKRQKEILAEYNKNIERTHSISKELDKINSDIYSSLSNQLGITAPTNESRKIFQVVRLKNLKVWSVSDFLKNENVKSKYDLLDLKNISEIIMGNSPSSKSLTKVAKGNIFIGGAADIKDGVVISERYINSDSKISKPGDILYLIRATIGSPIVADKKYYLGRGVAAIRANRKLIDSEYLINVLKLIEDNIKKLGTGSTFKQISKPILENIKIPVPPIEIQKMIALQIMSELNKIQKLKEQLYINEKKGIDYFENEIFSK